MQSRPETMYVDSIEFPEKYEEETRDLLEELVRSSRPITAEERRRLDRAVLDFNRYIPKQPPKPIQAAQKPRPITQTSDEDDEMTAPDLQPKEEVRAFWWL